MSGTIALIIEAARLAASDALDRAWRHLSVAHHPDHGGDAERFKLLAGARERMLAKKPETPKPSVPVAPPVATAIQPAEMARTTWCVVTEASLDQALAPEFLSAKLAHIKRLNLVCITHTKGEWLAELLVVELERDADALVTKPLRVLDLSAVPTIRTDWNAAVVENVGGPHLWGYQGSRRRADPEFPEEMAAKAWLNAKRLLARTS
jgi:hypothetical protein